LWEILSSGVKSIIIIVIIGVIVIGTMIMMRPAPIQNVSIDFDDVIIIESVPPLVDLKPWAGLNCTEMLDFSATADHNLMDDIMHIEFHEHYLNSCSDMKMDEELTSDECSGTARCIIGKVTKIIDGDTIHVNGESVRFALSSAPELGGFGGVESRDFIDTICPVGSDAIVDEDDSQTGESYGRIIGVVYCNGVNLNSELLDANLGYLENQFCDSSEFAGESWAIKHGC